MIKDPAIVSVREKMPVLKDRQGGISRGEDGCGARQDKSMGLARDGSSYSITGLYGMKGARW